MQRDDPQANPSLCESDRAAPGALNFVREGRVGAWRSAFGPDSAAEFFAELERWSAESAAPLPPFQYTPPGE